MQSAAIARIGLMACTLLAAPSLASPPSYGVVTRGHGWIYTRLGNPVDVTTQTHPGVLFEGGGTDVDDAYKWMCAKAGNGDVLVLRATGTADYNPYIAHLCPAANSVSTLLIENRRAAFDPFIAAAIAHAEALFIAGGSQNDYVNDWQGTPVAAAINTLARTAPVGGTSAGNAILGQFAFSALYNTVYSHDALADCYDHNITISDGFLNVSPYTTDTITDDHFVTRQRMGRLVTFLARIMQSGVTSQAFGIALNENTAFLMEPGGNGKAVGSSTVYFLRTPGPPQVCEPATPVTYTNIPVYRISRGGTFDIGKWSGQGGIAYELSAISGKLHSTQAGGKIY